MSLEDEIKKFISILPKVHPDLVKVDLPEFGPPEYLPMVKNDNFYEFKVTIKPTGRILNCTVPRKILEESLLKAGTISIQAMIIQEIQESIDKISKRQEERFIEQLNGSK